MSHPLPMLLLVLLTVSPLAAHPSHSSGNADAVAGVWVVQQVNSSEHLRFLRPMLDRALSTPHLRGFSLRAPWNAVDADFRLFEAGLALAREHGLKFSVRFMAGRHTPQRIFEAGSRFYLINDDEKVPAPFLEDGSPNRIFEREYRQYVTRLADWCRQNGVHLLHLSWYGQDWAELNHGKEVRAIPGYSYRSWFNAHRRLIDIGLRVTGPDLSVELPFSGYGPLTDAALAFAEHIVAKIGPNNPAFFCQANGWAPNGDWGAPHPDTEAAFDRVWALPICRAQQSIQPTDFDWAACFELLYDNHATYCEIYARSFSGERADELRRQVADFAAYCHRQTPMPAK